MIEKLNMLDSSEEVEEDLLVFDEAMNIDGSWTATSLNEGEYKAVKELPRYGGPRVFLGQDYKDHIAIFRVKK